MPDLDQLHLGLKTAQEAVGDAIRRQILVGEMPAGSRINQDAIAEKYGVSRIPVREALRQLQAEGLIEIIPHRGALVNSLSADEIKEVYEIRDALEPVAVRLAVPRATEANLKHLQQVLERMESEHTPSRWLDLDAEFHKDLYAASGRRRLCTLIVTLRRNTSRYLHIAARSGNRIELARDEHRRILAAYQCRDVDAAVRELRQQLCHTRNFLLDTLSIEASDGAIHTARRGGDARV